MVILTDAEAEQRWDAWLASFPGAPARQCHAWGRYKSEDWTPLYAAAGDAEKPSAMALVLWRRAPLGSATVAWANFGPVFQNPAAFAEILDGLKREFSRRPNPVLRVSPAAAATPELEDVLTRAGFKRAKLALDTGKTCVLDLSPNLEALRAGLERKWRNQLKTAEKNAPEFEAGSSKELLARYLRLHEETVRRKSLRAHGLTLPELERAAAALGERIVFILGSSGRRDGVGGAFLVFGDGAILWHMASDAYGLERNLPNAFYWEAVRRFKERGLKRLDLGGVDPEGNWGVTNFKRGLGGAEVQRLGEWDWSQRAPTRPLFNLALKLYKGKLV